MPDTNRPGYNMPGACPECGAPSEREGALCEQHADTRTPDHAMPRPWRFWSTDTSDDWILEHYDSGGLRVGRIARSADARLVVEAVNTHDSLRAEIARLTAERDTLVEALEASEALRDEWADSDHTEADGERLWAEWRAAIRAAREAMGASE